MGLGSIWKNYKVLIVMGTGLGVVHWGWYSMKSHPMFQPQNEDFVPEPGIVGYVMDKGTETKTK